MYSLGFDFRNGNWSIYLHGRDKPIGDIVPLPEGGWFGQMSLDGYNVSERGANPQIIVDAFEAWVAAGMPSNSSLLDEKSPCTTLPCEPKIKEDGWKGFIFLLVLGISLLLVLFLKLLGYKVG